MKAALIVVAVVIGLPGAATALHLGLLMVASIFYRVPRSVGDPHDLRFLVLVPAHNEALVIGDTLAALMADRDASDEVLVVADRCSDATADIARAAGAIVLERGPEEEAGRAAARQAGIEFALSRPWDGIVMIDADSIIEPGFFAHCKAAMAAGAPAVQARSEAAIGPRFLDHAAVAAFALQGVTMPRGRDRLGLMVRLRGTGMVLSRDVVTQFRFRAPASEDLWYSLDMCLAGLLPRHVEKARLRSLNVSNWGDAGTQRVRYEAGRISAAREFVGPLLRRHDKASLEAAWFLLTMPYSVGASSLVVATALAALAGGFAVAATFALLLGLLVLVLVVGLIQARAGPRTWLGLAIAPWYLPWKVVVQLRAMRSVRRGDREYAATPRN